MNTLSMVKQCLFYRINLISGYKKMRHAGVEPAFREPESHVRSTTLTAQITFLFYCINIKNTSLFNRGD